MRILVITPFLAAPGTDGGGTVMFNFIKNLSARHDIVYLTFARQQDLAQLSKVAPFCIDTVTVPLPGGTMESGLQRGLNLARRVVKNILSIATFTPVVVQKCTSPAMTREIRRAIERHKPDLVHFFFPQMAHYIDACNGIPAVMDTSDAALVGVFRRAMNARPIWAKAYYLMQWLLWVRYQSRYFPRFGKVLTVTHQDAAALRMVMPDLDVYADAIAVDIKAPSEAGPVPGVVGSIGFLASFNHEPNVDAALYFAQQILPLVRQRLPDAQFMVAGKNPPASLVEMRGAGVKCLGFVDDVTGFYGDAQVVVAPIRFGGGIKIKVLEAMSCGKAVVTTSVGAEGIAEPHEGALVVADDPEGFADAVVALLADQERRAVLGDEARRLMERKFSWCRFMDHLDGIYASLVQAKR